MRKLNKILLVALAITGLGLVFGKSANAIDFNGFITYNAGMVYTNDKALASYLKEIPTSNNNYRYLGYNVTDDPYYETVYTGYYPAVDSFQNDTIGAKPGNWNDNHGHSNNATVLASYGGHAYYLDINAINPGHEQGVDTIFSYGGVTKVNVSFWLAGWMIVADDSMFSLTDATRSNYAATLRYTTGGQLAVSWGAANWTNVVAISMGTWYHITIEADSDLDRFNVTVNGVRVASMFKFWNDPVTNLGRFNVYIGAVRGRYAVDAMDYSTDASYVYMRNYNQSIYTTSPDYGVMPISNNRVGGNDSFRPFNMVQMEIANYSDTINTTYGWQEMAPDNYYNWWYVRLQDNNVTFWAISGYPTAGTVIENRTIKINETYHIIDVNWQVSAVNISTKTQRVMWEFRLDNNNSRVYRVNYTNSINVAYGCNSTVWSFNIARANFATSAKWRHSLVAVRFLESVYAQNVLFPDFLTEYGWVNDFFNPPRPPTPPQKSWTYATWNITDDYDELVVVGNASFNWTYTATHIKAITVDVPFYYTEVTGNGPSDWGDWLGWAFNWLRDGLWYIVNGLWIAIQYLLFLLWGGVVNYLLMGLVMGIIVPFGWNVLILGVIWILNWLFWWLVYSAVPWLVTDVLPLLADVIVIAFSALLAIIVWIFTFGTGDLGAIYANILGMNQAISDQFLGVLGSIFDALPVILGYMAEYAFIVIFVELKRMYVEARGFPNRGNQLLRLREAFLLPIRVLAKLVEFLKQLLPFDL